MKKSLKLAAIFAACVCFLTGCQSFDYSLAQKKMEDGKYSEAREIFSELGEYEDSEKYAKDCMWQMLYEQYPNVDDIDKTFMEEAFLEESAIYSNEELGVLMFIKAVNIPELRTVVKICIIKGTDEATALGANILTTDALDNGNPTTITGNAAFKLSQYDESYNMDWNLECEQDISSIEYILENNYDNAIKDLMSYANDEFDKNGLGFTLADIGFKSY